MQQQVTPVSSEILAEYNLWVDKMMRMSPSFQQVGRSGYHPGLTTMKAFDEFLENPHRQFRSVHIAGTNGKGSVSHMLASICAEHGLKTGLYTSPHLADFRERIRINGVCISHQAVVDFFRRTADFIEQNQPSFFEITTAMAWDYFARNGVDVAMIEVGLGGRMDSTNLITPELSIVTSIGYDHCDILGNTLPEIAREKGGIIKSGIPLVLGEIQEELVSVFETIAAPLNAPVLDAQRAELKWQVALPDLDAMDLQGDYQAANLRTVAAALQILERVSFAKPIDWHVDKVRQALSHTAQRTHFRGRWEQLYHQPDIICDIAHNQAGLQYTLRQLQRRFEAGKAEGKYERLVFILGMVADKDIEQVRKLFPVADYYFTQPPGPRAMDANHLAGHFLEKARKSIITSTVTEALITYFSQAQPTDLVYLGGSSYVVAEALKFSVFEKIAKN